MSKKSLSDLLREEAQESPVSSADPSPSGETSPPNPPREQDHKSTEFNQLQSQLNQAQAQVNSLKADLQQEKSHGEDLKRQLGNYQKADQKQAKALETAQQTIKTLEKTLKQEQSTVKTLQKELQAIAERHTDLETEKLLVDKLHRKIQDLETRLAETQSPPPLTLAVRPSAMPSRYIAPVQPPSHLTDEDIGWFD
jgi:chromosome segregation ATPase